MQKSFRYLENPVVNSEPDTKSRYFVVLFYARIFYIKIKTHPNQPIHIQSEQKCKINHAQLSSKHEDVILISQQYF